MFEIKTYLEKHSNKTSYGNTREDYVGLDEPSKLEDYFASKKFTPEYIQVLVTIQYKEKVLVGIDGLNGLDLWEQTYLDAIKQYVENRNAETMYGIDPTILKLKSSGGGLLRFMIIDEFEPNDVYVDATLPEREFLETLLIEAEHFWQVLIDYKVFEERKVREDTPSDYPAQMIKELKKLREKVKLLN